ncbi:hypothetical protein B9057_15725 (plasmid) [Aestuarium zhoushanense]|nr:hypothetical protein B9057_15725 [Aestuarium zhoushanense]
MTKIQNLKNLSRQTLTAAAAPLSQQIERLSTLIENDLQLRQSIMKQAKDQSAAIAEKDKTIATAKKRLQKYQAQVDTLKHKVTKQERDRKLLMTACGILALMTTLSLFYVTIAPNS